MWLLEVEGDAYQVDVREERAIAGSCPRYREKNTTSLIYFAVTREYWEVMASKAGQLELVMLPGRLCGRFMLCPMSGQLEPVFQAWSLEGRVIS